MLAILPSNLTFSNSVILCHRMKPATAVFLQNEGANWIGSERNESAGKRASSFGAANSGCQGMSGEPAPEILPGFGFVILESRFQDAADQCHYLGNLRKAFIVIGDPEHQTFSLWTGHLLSLCS